MEIMQPYFEEKREVKLCRLCGSDNKENIDIFSSKPLSSRCDDLLKKILTVYPLVLYKDDPLPQHICPKCIGYVSTTYQDIQQVLRQQNKWMSITKAMQPEHKYFGVLNAVETYTKATKESIKNSYNIEINGLPLKKLLALPSRENINVATSNAVCKANINENVVKDIQTKLESNGFTIKRIKVPTEQSNAEQNNALNVSNESLDLTDSSDESECNTIVTCNYCQQKFSNLKVLAQHQLIHLDVKTNKIFQKRLLHKSLRRGRLITINDSKCIRCLNCWRIFKDNKAILQHWSGGECEYFCFVCGKEFAHSPKLLREHVPTVHGISYRSSVSCSHSHRSRPTPPTESVCKPSPLYPPPTTITTVNTNKVNKYKKPSKTCIKNDDGTITCRKCHKTFTNFRSCNSHMRKHKPTIRYGDKVFASPTTRSDNYNTQDDYTSLQPSTSYSLYGTNNTSYPSSTANYFHMKFPRPPYRLYPKNDNFRGIRTKIVEKRHDFMANNGIQSHQPTHHRQIPLTSETNKDNADNDDDTLIIPELMPTFIKKEPMPQDEGENSGSMEHREYGNSSLEPLIKSEPIDSTEDMNTSETVCFICNEHFTNSREYNLHAMFVHNIN